MGWGEGGERCRATSEAGSKFACPFCDVVWPVNEDHESDAACIKARRAALRPGAGGCCCLPCLDVTRVSPHGHVDVAGIVDIDSLRSLEPFHGYHSDIAAQ